MFCVLALTSTIKHLNCLNERSLVSLCHSTNLQPACTHSQHRPATAYQTHAPHFHWLLCPGSAAQFQPACEQAASSYPAAQRMHLTPAAAMHTGINSPLPTKHTHLTSTGFSVPGSAAQPQPACGQAASSVKPNTWPLNAMHLAPAATMHTGINSPWPTNHTHQPYAPNAHTTLPQALGPGRQAQRPDDIMPAAQRRAVCRHAPVPFQDPASRAGAAAAAPAAAAAARARE